MSPTRNNMPRAPVSVSEPVLFNREKFERGNVFGAFPNYIYEVDKTHDIAVRMTEMVDTIFPQALQPIHGKNNLFYKIEGNNKKNIIDSVKIMVDQGRVNVTNMNHFDIGLRMSLELWSETDPPMKAAQVTKDMNEANLTLWAAAKELHPRVFACAVVYNRPVYLVERCTALNDWLKWTRANTDIQFFKESLENIMDLAARNGLLMTDIKTSNMVVDMGGSARFIDMDPTFTARIDVEGDNGGNGVVSCIKFINSLLLLNSVARYNLSSRTLRQTKQMFEPLLEYVKKTMTGMNESNISDLCMQVSHIMFDDIETGQHLPKGNNSLEVLDPVNQAQRIMYMARRYSGLQTIPANITALKGIVDNIEESFNRSQRPMLVL